MFLCTWLFDIFLYGFEHRIGNIQGFTKSKQSKEKMIQEQAHLTLTSQLRVRTFIFLSTSYFQGEVDPGEVQGSHAPSFVLKQ